MCCIYSGTPLQCTLCADAAELWRRRAGSLRLKLRHTCAHLKATTHKVSKHFSPGFFYLLPCWEKSCFFALLRSFESWGEKRKKTSIMYHTPRPCSLAPSLLLKFDHAQTKQAKSSVNVCSLCVWSRSASEWVSDPPVCKFLCYEILLLIYLSAHSFTSACSQMWGLTVSASDKSHIRDSSACSQCCLITCHSHCNICSQQQSVQDTAVKLSMCL